MWLMLRRSFQTAWLRLDPKAANLVRYWVKERGMVGIRMTEAIKGSDTSWVSGPIAQEIWSACTKLGASVCFHFMRWNRETCMAALKDMCIRFPETTVVVDHFSNLIGEQGPPDFGVDQVLEDLVPFPNVYQKFTMINVSKLADLGLPCAPVVKRMVQSFGADRIMWGSDVAQSKGTYAEMVLLGQRAVRLLNETERRQVLSGTAHAVYARM
jgi:predicted TIM-barrel fold metal-dependent hydrolase